MKNQNVDCISEHEVIDDVENPEKKFPPWYTAEERSVFVAIDRYQENKDIVRFQRNKSIKLFDKIYENRIPTLQIWAKRYHYLMDSEDDMFGELSCYFYKAIMTYKGNRGSFNTWLFACLIHGVRNLQIGRMAKKRLPEGIDPNHMKKFILSMDYNYNNKDGSENTLKDIIADKLSTRGNIYDNMCLNETVNILSRKNPLIVGFLKKLSDGNTLTSALKEYKTRKGKINISYNQYKKLRSNLKYKRVVCQLIKNKANIQEKFMLVNYCVINPNKLHYIIEMSKTEEADMILRTIRKIRKEKNFLLEKIGE